MNRKSLHKTGKVLLIIGLGLLGLNLYDLFRSDGFEGLGSLLLLVIIVGPLLLLSAIIMLATRPSNQKTTVASSPNGSFSWWTKWSSKQHLAVIYFMTVVAIGVFFIFRLLDEAGFQYDMFGPVPDDAGSAFLFYAFILTSLRILTSFVLMFGFIMSIVGMLTEQPSKKKVLPAILFGILMLIYLTVR